MSIYPIMSYQQVYRNLMNTIKYNLNSHTNYFQAGTGFDTTIIILHDHSVQSCVFLGYFDDFQYLYVVSFFYRDSSGWRGNYAIFVPFHPW